MFLAKEEKNNGKVHQLNSFYFGKSNKDFSSLVIRSKNKVEYMSLSSRFRIFIREKTLQVKHNFRFFI